MFSPRHQPAVRLPPLLQFALSCELTKFSTCRRRKDSKLAVKNWAISRLRPALVNWLSAEFGLVRPTLFLRS
jgi:hypothetical protein